jgi:hypothetical protein
MDFESNLYGPSSPQIQSVGNSEVDPLNTVMTVINSLNTLNAAFQVGNLNITELTATTLRLSISV